MERSIVINEQSCIKCGRCVRVCPSRLFSQSKVGADVGVTVQGCIVCGHCVGICPSNSITHSDFPADRVHKIDYEKMPTSEQVLLLCRSRRSNRAFSNKEIPPQMLDMILEAAHRAPTASNMQTVEFTLVTGPENLRFISQFTLDVFGLVVKKLENPILRPILKLVMPGVYDYVPTFKRLVTQFEKGDDLVLRGAMAVILIHTPKGSRFGCQDANLAYQNGSLMAESLGVGQFYTGFVCSAITQDKSDRLAKKLGIKGTIHAAMALGMPSFRFENYIDKNEIKVNRL